VICVLAAFGAAFLVARAVNHETPARAATTTPVHATPVVAHVGAPKTTTTNAELVSEFAPVSAKLKRRPKPHRHHHKASPPPAPVQTTSAPSIDTTPAPVVTQPTYTPPPAPTHSSGSTHKKKPSGGGSGTTTIG
jgi:hypothetical protein